MLGFRQKQVPQTFGAGLGLQLFHQFDGGVGIAGLLVGADFFFVTLFIGENVRVHKIGNALLQIQ